MDSAGMELKNVLARDGKRIVRDGMKSPGDGMGMG